MKVSEILADVLALAEEDNKLEPNDTLKRQWIKSVYGLDKSVSTGYSLVGDFVTAAVLGNKKGSFTAEATLVKTFY